MFKTWKLIKRRIKSFLKVYIVEQLGLYFIQRLKNEIIIFIGIQHAKNDRSRKYG